MAVWQHGGLVDKLTYTAKDAIETSQLLLSLQWSIWIFGSVPEGKGIDSGGG
jgi:hypothetical protein